ATASPPARAGRFALQLGAFSDRGLALDLVRRYGRQVPDLRIDTERDDRGQLLYKVRSGSYVNPALARDAADALKRSLGIEVFVAELGG
ncbi:MAG: SPOR domain-containing protein, partial [Krumholzibacteria bacterium]|nr:SPOR domain-containing protein [Candidatus Krumholzibacteria bacterium]